MVKFGLDVFTKEIPSSLKGKRIGLVCHAASVMSDYTHAIDALLRHPDCRLGAVFGPQHGLFGQTQDNMIEWEGGEDPLLGISVYSLYGRVRKPTPRMLDGIDALVFDIQDVGARPYTYVWTLKLCMEACQEKGISLWVLDRPNPIGCIGVDGPMLLPEYFTFVGGARIPLCHRLTMGEMALLLQKEYFPSLELNVVWMENWWRNSFWPETSLPWVLPSPNMPTPDTAAVYPGMVLLEATNMSEGRGTTRPFEIVGAPYFRMREIKEILQRERLEGCFFREHAFIPTFQKWKGEYCGGVQVHVTDLRKCNPVLVTVALLLAVKRIAGADFQFKEPPYEYETEKMPFDILSGSSELREAIEKDVSLSEIKESWSEGHREFREVFSGVSRYPEERP
ncbi:MAG: DUF1343 domain-containing protein [Fibrobacter sp.]|jgi:uncharacterized protein YbbC (DUF1343 family)|nr:DUF1343 domain-containing protein [Fibrobacter sp.]